jgi:hypothetical protein
MAKRTTQSAIFKKANQLMREGMGRSQAFKVAYSELGEPVRKTARKAARKTTVKRVVKNPVKRAAPKRKVTVRRAKPTTTIKLFSNPKRKTQPKKKPVPIVKGHRPRSTYTDYIVSESANGKTGWKVVATFLHEKNAVEYAHALEHKNAIEKRSRYIQITTQLHELRRKSAA